ncbi:MAG: hypothetical protein A2Y31_00035 [Spirochaetes bacterium GWC2_52_13]|nr:MAG: hypothetical protein A2Y31_00035 [Spirochaetes bacterium GWC2_52_13]
MAKRNFLWRVVDSILLLTVSGMLLVVIIQVVGRIISKSVPWSEELTRYLFLWTVNIGMAVGMRYADHASVNVIYLLLPKTKIVRRIHLSIYATSCVVFFALLTYWNIGMTFRQFNSGEMSPALELPMFLVSLPLFVCDILAAVGLVQSAFFDKSTRERIVMLGQNESLERLEGGSI